MIEQGIYIVPPQDDFPGIVGVRRAVVPCGCTIVVGKRTDNHEVSTTMLRCCDEHEKIGDRSYELLLASMDNPTTFPLITVVDTFLNQAYEEITGQTA